MQSFALIGLVDDGSALNPEMPRNTATTITFPQYADVTLSVGLFYNSGVPVDLSKMSGWVGTFTMQRSVDPCLRVIDPRVGIQKKVTQLPAGPLEIKNVLSFDLAAQDTRQLVLGRYYFDVWLTDSLLDRWQVIATSSAILVPGLFRG